MIGDVKEVSKIPGNIKCKASRDGKIYSESCNKSLSREDNIKYRTDMEDKMHN